MQNKDLLLLELQYNGISIINGAYCSFYYKGKKVKSKIKTKKQFLRNNIIQNNKIAEQILKEIKDKTKQQVAGQVILDIKDIKIFISSVKNLYNLVKLLTKNRQIIADFRKILNRDIYSFDRQFVENLVDYKLALDFILRKNNKNSFILNLLCEVEINKKLAKTSTYKVVKTSQQGSMLNLDLPMNDRFAPYSWMDSDFRDGQRTDRYQSRYQNGLSNYQTVGKTAPRRQDIPAGAQQGGGNGTWGGSSQGIWLTGRKDEPYSYSDQDSQMESPYPHRPETWKR